MSKQVKALRMIETHLLLKCAASHSGFLNEQGSNFRIDTDLEMLGDFRPGLPKPIPKSIPNKEMNLSIFFCEHVRDQCAHRFQPAAGVAQARATHQNRGSACSMCHQHFRGNFYFLTWT